MLIKNDSSFSNLQFYWKSLVVFRKYKSATQQQSNSNSKVDNINKKPPHNGGLKFL